MWVEIKKDIFEDSDVKGLNFILQLLTWHPIGSIPRYQVFVNAEKIQHLENYKNLPDIDKDIIERQFDEAITEGIRTCLLYTSPSPRDATLSRMPSSA